MAGCYLCRQAALEVGGEGLEAVENRDNAALLFDGWDGNYYFSQIIAIYSHNFYT